MPYQTRECPKNRGGNPWDHACQDIAEWGAELEAWGKKVDAYLTQICGLLNQLNMPCTHIEAKQPGDPPPPPWRPA